MRKKAGTHRADPSVAIWVRLLRTHNLIMNRIRPAMAAKGMTLPRFDLLAQLTRAPGGLTFSQLSSRLLVSAGNLTGIVRRLEREGLVRRDVVSDDRRSYRIRLSARGSRLMQRLIPEHRREIEQVLAAVPRKVRVALRKNLGLAAEALAAGGAGKRDSTGPSTAKAPAVRTRKNPRSRLGSLSRRTQAAEGGSRARRAS